MGTSQILPLLTAISQWVGGTPQLPSTQVACSAPAVTPIVNTGGVMQAVSNSNHPLTLLFEQPRVTGNVATQVGGITHLPRPGRQDEHP